MSSGNVMKLDPVWSAQVAERRDHLDFNRDTKLELHTSGNEGQQAGHDTLATRIWK